jgi:hypothetical protein
MSAPFFDAIKSDDERAKHELGHSVLQHRIPAPATVPPTLLAVPQRSLDGDATVAAAAYKPVSSGEHSWRLHPPRLLAGNWYSFCDTAIWTTRWSVV